MKLFRYSFLVLQFSLFISLAAINSVAAEETNGQSNLVLITQIKENRSHQNLSTSALDLLAQQNGITEVTGVKINQTESGLEVILETAAGEQLVPLIFPEGNNLVVEILDATLVPMGNEFRQTNPAAGIREVSVTQVDESSIRLTITGENQAPSAEVVSSQQNLILSVSPEGTTAQTEPDEEIEIIATGEGEEDDYYVPDASTATRTDTPLRDIPQSIQVIPEQVLEDQQVVELNEALRNVSGVTFGGTTYGFTYNFNIRGFANAPILRDGFRQYGFFSTGVPESTNLERIEVLKGPASILYSEIQPGGVINLVTKKPLSQPFYQAELEIGNSEFFRPQIDISGPLDLEGNVLYRLNAAYQSADSFLNYDTEIERFFIAPSLTWKIGDRTDLTVSLEYTDDERPTDFGLFAVGERIVNIPYDRIVGQPDDKAETEQFRVGYDLEHRFNDNWTLRNAFRYIYTDSLLEGFYAGEFDETTGILGRQYATSAQTFKDYSLQTNIVGKFATGSVNHTLLFGVDLSHAMKKMTAGLSLIFLAFHSIFLTQIMKLRLDQIEMMYLLLALERRE